MGAKRMGYFSREEFVGGECPALESFDCWFPRDLHQHVQIHGCARLSTFPGAGCNSIAQTLLRLVASLGSQAQLGLLTSPLGCTVLVAMQQHAG